MLILAHCTATYALAWVAKEAKDDSCLQLHYPPWNERDHGATAVFQQQSRLVHYSLWGNPPGAGVRMSNTVADSMSLQWAAMPWELAGDRCLHRQGSLRNMCWAAASLCQAVFLVGSVCFCVLIMQAVAGEPRVVRVATLTGWAGWAAQVCTLQLNHWNRKSSGGL